MRGRSTVRWTRALAAGLLVALTGCGDPDSSGADAGGDQDVAQPEDTSSPFTVGEIPESYEPVNAGIGNATPNWGADSSGTDEPFTVLAPVGSSDPAERVIVSLTGFEGYQGGLGQTIRMAVPTDITIDGRDAVHVDAGEGGRSTLVAVRGPDLAVRVTAPGATLEQLTEILEAVEVPTDRARAPQVPTPPAGLEVVGSVDVDAVLAMQFSVEANTDRLGVLDSTHVAGWMDRIPTNDEGGDRPGDLSVMTLPARAADIDVLDAYDEVGLGQHTWERTEVGGDPALLVERAEQLTSFWGMRSVWRWTDSGDIVVVATGNHPDELLSFEALQGVAAAVTPADQATWDRFVTEMTGGPGVSPDRGWEEITRGTRQGEEWLLQTAPFDRAEGVDDITVAHCLQLSGNRRACTRWGGTVQDWVGYGGDEGRSQVTFDDLVIVSTTLDAASLRITTPADSVEVPLHPVPGTQLRAAVAFVDEPGDASCTTDLPMEPPEGMTFMRIDALDDAGAVVDCIGAGGHPYSGVLNGD